MGQFFNKFRKSDSSTSYPYDYSMNPSMRPSDPDRKKKKRIIAIILVFLILLFFIILAIFSSNKEIKTKADGETVNVFNKFANWIIYGEEKDDPIEIMSIDELSGTSLEDSLEDNDAEFFEKSFQLFDDFYEKYYNDEKADAEFIFSIEGIRSDLEFLKLYSEHGEIDEEDLEKIYSEKGYIGALEYIEDFYEPYKNSDLVSTQSFGEEKEENDLYELSILDLAHRFGQNGCQITEEQPNELCSSILSEAQALEERSEEIDELYVNKYNITDVSVENINKNILEISTQL